MHWTNISYIEIKRSYPLFTAKCYIHGTFFIFYTKYFDSVISSEISISSLMYNTQCLGFEHTNLVFIFL